MVVRELDPTVKNEIIEFKFNCDNIYLIPAGGKNFFLDNNIEPKEHNFKTILCFMKLNTSFGIVEH